MEILNRKASFDYNLLDKYEAGIKLNGFEVKSIRQGNCNLNECVFKGTNKCSKVKCFDYQGIDRIDVIFKEVKNDKD